MLFTSRAVPFVKEEGSDAADATRHLAKIVCKICCSLFMLSESCKFSEIFLFLFGVIARVR